MDKEKIRGQRSVLAEEADSVKKQIAQLRKQRETLVGHAPFYPIVSISL